MENSPKLDIINARTIKFECPSAAMVEYATDDKGNIIRVTYSGNQANISVGASFILDIEGTVTSYDIKEIKQGDNEHVFMLNTHPVTKATNFLLPILSVAQGPIGYPTDLINCYVRKYDDFPSQLALLYRNSNDAEFKRILNNVNNIPGFVQHISYEKFFTVFIYDVEQKFMEDLQMFLKGKYSKLSDVLKSRIIRFHKLKKSSVLYKLLYRDQGLKKFIEMDLQDEIPEDIDLYSIPDPQIEILNV